MNANYLKLEKGKQIGIRKRILKGNKYYWYSVYGKIEMQKKGSKSA